MRRGEVFIIPIVQESWINALAENELGRIDCASGPRPGPDELRKFRGSALTPRFGSQFIGGDASAAARPAGVRRGGSSSLDGGIEYIGPSNCRVSARIVKPRC